MQASDPPIKNPIIDGANKRGKRSLLEGSECLPGGFFRQPGKDTGPCFKRVTFIDFGKRDGN